MMNEAGEEIVEMVPEGEPVFGSVENTDNSILGKVGSVVAPVFEPLGFGDWKPTVATALGLVAKEEVVAVFGVLYDTDTDELDTMTMLDEEISDEEKAEQLHPLADGFNEMSGGYGQLAAYAFLVFNLLCAPCFAAIGAIKREMNNAKWTWFAITYQCGFAYAVALMVFQLGKLFAGAGFTVGTGAAFAVMAFMLYMLLRKNKYMTKATKSAGIGA